MPHTDRFSSLVRDAWSLDDAGVDRLAPDELRIVVDDTLPENRAVMMLQLVGGAGTVTTTSLYAARLGLVHGTTTTRIAAHATIAAHGVSLNDPDRVFYLPVRRHDEIAATPATSRTLRLTGDDGAAFARFTSVAPSDELDEAFVELDHWLVFGTFVDGHLACAASMYPWAGTRLADLGVITLPEFRSRGLASLTVRAFSTAALSAEHEPQYRCQIGNHASVALARTAGFENFATWYVIDSGD